MKQEEFEKTLGQFKHRKPFVPFVIELLDGRAIHVDEPAVAFDEEGGTFLTEEGEKVTFHREEIVAIKTQEGAMTREEFDAALLKLKRQQPFIPFMVELLDGGSFLVDQPAIAFCNGAATCLAADQEIHLFDYHEIRAMREAAQGVSP